MIYGDYIIEYLDGTAEKVGDSEIKIEDGWLVIGAHRDKGGEWHEARHIPLVRVREVRRWDRHGMMASYDAVMAMSPEQQKAIFDAPIVMMGEGEPEGPA